MAEQKTAIVTGAGSGIGRATAIGLAARGYRLVVVGRRRDKLEETARLAGEAGGGSECVVVAADLRESTACAAVVAGAVEAFGRVDVLANVAGSAPMMQIREVTGEDWRACVDTNLSSVVHLTAAVWPVFERQGGGVVVNVSSMSTIDPFPGLAIYAAAKAGLNMFTRCTAQEGASIGVRAVAVAPGAVETPMLRGLFSTDAIPEDRTLSPEDVAGEICGCVTGQRAFKPGETIAMASP